MMNVKMTLRLALYFVACFVGLAVIGAGVFAMKQIIAEWPVESTLTWTPNAAEDMVTHYNVCIKLNPAAVRCVSQGQAYEASYKFMRNPSMHYWVEVSAVDFRGLSSVPATMRVEPLLIPNK